MLSVSRAYFVPALASAMVAGLSLIYFSSITLLTDPLVMASYIGKISLAALIQCIFVPQAWLIVFKHDRASPRSKSLFSVMLCELLGAISGLSVLILARHFFGWDISWIAFLSFCMAGSTSVNGYYRRTGRWISFFLSIVISSLLRLLIWVWISHNAHKYDTDQLILRLHFIPEMFRYAVFHLSVMAVSIRRVRIHSLRFWAEKLMGNWQYDILSALSDVFDKFIVATLATPVIAVGYFMARKFASGATIVADPLFAVEFRKLSQIHPRFAFAEFERFHFRALVSTGLGSLALLGIYMLAVGCCVTPKLGSIFAWISFSTTIIFLLDLLVTANKWSRYRAIAQNVTSQLSAFRVMENLIFCAVLYFSNGQSVILGFAMFAFLDCVGSLAVFRMARNN